jgi:hypothetical protein
MGADQVVRAREKHSWKDAQYCRGSENESLWSVQGIYPRILEEWEKEVR